MHVEDSPFGTWPSPVTARMLTTPSVGRAEVRADGTSVWWNESRPDEDGRAQLVRRTVDGRRADILPSGYDARSRVHEYGGGAWTVHDGTVLFTNFADQRVYRLDPGATVPLAITPDPTARCGWRYADLRIVHGKLWGGSTWVVAVRESHEPDALAQHGEPANEVVAFPLDGSAADRRDDVVVLVTGPDFVASPRAGAGRLAWVQWDHPNMPFDNTSLWVADLSSDQRVPTLGASRRVAGGTTEHPEAVMEPRWDAAGDLWFISDRSSWWNLYRWDGRAATHIAPLEAELGHPAWGLGASTYGFLPDGRVVAALTRHGRSDLVVVDPHLPERSPVRLETGLSAVQQVVVAQNGEVVAVAGGPERPLTTPTVDHDGEVRELRPSADVGGGSEWWSPGEPIEFPSADGRVARAVLYRPHNPQVTPPAGTRPPLVVILHGGPTSQADTSLRYAVQFWTTRGFAVADVNYTGSTGYGRDYRRALYGRWGVVDVEDCLAVLRHLDDAGVVDGSRAAIRGGSAGGFTTLAVLTHPANVFATGASYFGVADLEALALHTHKFESRYLDQLLGPLPGAQAVYRERSPILHVDRLTVPLAVFQGADDPVVPPEQSRMIVSAVRDKGLACEYVEFEGEQHGFRRSESIVRAAETELAFYRKVFGLDG